MLIVQILRLQQIHQLQPAQYPHVPAAQFERWRGLEQKSASLFILSTLALAVGMGIGFFLLRAKFFVPAAASASQQSGTPFFAIVMGVGALIFFIGLAVSAVFGSQAAELRKTLQITL